MTPLEQERQAAFKELVLQEWGEYVTDYLRQRIDKLDLINSGHLKDSLRFTVVNADQMRLEITFADYGRIIDIFGSQLRREFRRHMQSKATMNRLAFSGTRKRKNTRWYSKSLWSRLPLLIERLTWGYGDWVRENFADGFGGRSKDVAL